MRSAASLVVVAAIALGVSCGLPGANGSGSGAGGSSSSSSATTGTGGGVASTSHSSAVSGGSSSASATGGAGGASGGGGGAGGTSSGSGGTSSSGGCTPGDPGVCCPTDSCSQKCCQNMGVITCQSACTAMQHFDCDDSSDCGGGMLCCAHYDGAHYDSDVHCVQPTMCVPPQNEGDSGVYEMCDLSQPICMKGTCQPSSQLGGGNHGFCF